MGKECDKDIRVFKNDGGIKSDSTKSGKVWEDASDPFKVWNKILYEAECVRSSKVQPYTRTASGEYIRVDGTEMPIGYIYVSIRLISNVYDNINLENKIGYYKNLSDVDDRYIENKKWNRHIFYIGRRMSCTYDKDYKGSGSDYSLAEKYYGFCNFRNEVLEWCFSLEDLMEAEFRWIDKFKAVESSLFYNKVPGGAWDGFRKRVICLDDDIIYESVTCLSFLVNLDQSNLSFSIKSRKLVNGKRYMYMDDYNVIDNPYDVEYTEKTAIPREVICVDTGKIFKSSYDVLLQFKDDPVKYKKYDGRIPRYCLQYPHHKIDGLRYMFLNDYNDVENIDDVVFYEFEENAYSRRVICLDTGEVFKSVQDVQHRENKLYLGNVCSEIKNHIPVNFKRYMYFDEYKDCEKSGIFPKFKYPSTGRKRVIDIGTGKTYNSVSDLCDEIGEKYVSVVSKKIKSGKEVKGHKYRFMENGEI